VVAEGAVAAAAVEDVAVAVEDVVEAAAAVDEISSMRKNK